MKRIVNALGKLSQGKRAYAVFALYAATATALSAQTFTNLTYAQSCPEKQTQHLT
jgi:ATP/ADP translocase